MEVIAIDPAFGYPKSVRAELVEALRQACHELAEWLRANG
jgi:hypothetical protein